mgnify:CR=1 FL=1
MEAIDLVLKHNNLEQTVHILEMLLEGDSSKSVAKELGISVSWVNRVKKKYLPKEVK